MRRTIKQIFNLLLAAVCVASCNDADYSVMGTTAFLQESLNEAGISGEVITVPQGGKKLSLTMALSDKLSEDVVLKFTVDEAALSTYNKEQSAEYLLMEESLYDLGGEVTIPAGRYVSEPIEIVINEIPQEIADRPMALPLSMQVVKGGVTANPVTSKYVVAVSPILTNELAQFNGGAGLNCEEFSAFYPQYTIECRFQMENSANRNRFVFNNGKLSGRFEDPQQDQDGHKAHAMVQFHVAPHKWFNPSLSFESNKWQHLAATYDGKALNLYVNGAFAGTHDYPVEDAGQFNKLNWFEASTWWEQCKLLITEVRVWSVCRSESQLQSNMKSVLPTSAGLEGYWRINKATWNADTKSFEDLTGKGHPLTVSSSRVTTMKWIPGVSSEDEKTSWQ